MFKSKELKITTSEKYEVNNEVPIHLRSISKNMEVKEDVEMDNWMCLGFVKILILNIRSQIMVRNKDVIGPESMDNNLSGDAATAAKFKNQFKESENKMLIEIIEKNHCLLNFHFKNKNREDYNLGSFERLMDMDFKQDITSIECMMFQEAYSLEQAGKIAQKILSENIAGEIAIHRVEKFGKDENCYGLGSYAVEFIIQENCIPDLVRIPCGGVTIYSPWTFICD